MFQNVKIFSNLFSAFEGQKLKSQPTSPTILLPELDANNGDTIITIGIDRNCFSSKKDKTEQNLRRKHSLAHDGSLIVLAHICVYKI